MTTDFSAPAVTVRGPVGGGITFAADPDSGQAAIECWGGSVAAPRLLVRGLVGAAELAELAEHVVGPPGAERTFELSAQPPGAMRLRHTGGAVVRVTASRAGHVVGVITIDRTRLAHQARMFADALSVLG
jgi:hypothetical protein